MNCKCGILIEDCAQCPNGSVPTEQEVIASGVVPKLLVGRALDAAVNLALGGEWRTVPRWMAPDRPRNGTRAYCRLVMPNETDEDWTYVLTAEQAAGMPHSQDPWGPHVSTNMNACFEAQAKCIEKVGMTEYVQALADVRWQGTNFGIPCGIRDIGLFATADAATRCRAMLAAIEATNSKPGNPSTCNAQDLSQTEDREISGKSGQVEI